MLWHYGKRFVFVLVLFALAACSPGAASRAFFSCASIATDQALQSMDQTKFETTQITLKKLDKALREYMKDNDGAPTTEQGLAALQSPPTNGPQPLHYRAGGYWAEKEIPVDPWGNAYQYLCDNGFIFVLFSLGPDGESGTEDDVFYRAGFDG